MKLTDTHCHLDIEQFDTDRGAVIERARAAGVGRILIPGLTLAGSRSAIEMSKANPLLYNAIGIHPNDAAGWDDNSISRLRALAAGNQKVVAIGEVGLDYYWDSVPHPAQITILKEQLALAAEVKLPVILHCREQADAEKGSCQDDLLELLEEWVDALAGSGMEQPHPLEARPGVLHSFSGSLESAQHAIRMGFFIGVTGPVTYKNADRRRQMVAGLPLDRVLIETDAPYLAPHPYRGKRNEPAFVAHIADKIAEIRSRTPQEIAAVTSSNAARLFAWGETD